MRLAEAGARLVTISVWVVVVTLCRAVTTPTGTPGRCEAPGAPVSRTRLEMLKLDIFLTSSCPRPGLGYAEVRLH